MAVKKSELYSSLWASCDALRGGMDASQYKDYILTLLFVKYVSDKFAGQDYADIEIPDGGSFADMVKLIGKKDIGEGINKVIAKLAETNGLRGVIDKVSFNDPDKLGKGEEMVEKLSKLIEIFRRPELDFSKNQADGDDLIGDAYEYLMRKFATESGKSKGQFYTPAEVSRVLAKVIGIAAETNPSATVYDPACGSGSLLIRALNEAPLALSGYGQEKDTTTAGLAKMNKEDAAERTGIFMIDASHDFVKDGNKNRLRERDIYKIVTTFNQQITDDPHYARFVPMKEITAKNSYNLNISRYIDSGIEEDRQSIEAHLKGGIPAYDIDSMDQYWSVFGQLKNKLFSVLREGFYQLNVSKDEVRTLIYEDAEFASYADKIDNAFMAWRSEIDEELRSINAYVNAKDLIIRLAEHILVQFEGIELIDKYDVYQVLLAYWMEVMSDDVYLLIHDGYEAGRELSYEYVVKTKTVDGKTVTETTDKVKSWDGKLIPKAIIIDTYFAEKAKAIDDAEVIIADTQAQIDELLENVEDGSSVAELMDDKGKISAKTLKSAIDEIRSKIQSEEISALTALQNALPLKKKDMERYLMEHPLCTSARNDKGNVNASSIKARILELRATTPVPKMYAEDYEQLMSLYTLMTRNDEQSKLVKALKAALEQLVKDKYTVLTVEEIKELLVNKKWYYSIYDGIDALYVAISHSITNRIVELAERYEDTLPCLSALVDDYEVKVKSHLERMGFKW